MKTLLSIFVLLGLLSLGNPLEAAVLNPKSAPAKTEHVTNGTNHQMSKKEERKLRRDKRRTLRKNLRDTLREARRTGDVELVVLIIIGLLIPPLAMFLYDGEASNRFWISLGLLIGGLLLVGTLGALASLASVIYTLFVIISESA